MVSQNNIDEFLSQKRIAVVGVSLSGKKFGATVFNELKSKGFQTYAVNSKIDGQQKEGFYANLKSIPELVEGVVTVIPPETTEKVIEEAVKLNIKHIWMQQGSESEKAIKFCKEKEINVIYNECILMFAQPIGFGHNIHRWIWKVLGKLPK